MQTNDRVKLLVSEADSPFRRGHTGVVTGVIPDCDGRVVLVKFDGDTRPCPQIVSAARLEKV